MAKSLTKTDIVEQLCEKFDISKKDARDLVDSFFLEIREILTGGTPVRLSGFGNFELRDKGERPGRNPKTGQGIPITARRVVTFKPGQKLRAKVAARDRAQSRAHSTSTT